MTVEIELTEEQERIVRMKDYVLYPMRKSFSNGNRYSFLTKLPGGYRPAIYPALVDTPYLFVALVNRGGGDAVQSAESYSQELIKRTVDVCKFQLLESQDAAKIVLMAQKPTFYVKVTVLKNPDSSLAAVMLEIVPNTQKREFQ
jgi:hypothetical protein